MVSPFSLLVDSKLILVQHMVSPLVNGVSGACYKKYPSEAAAIAAFEEAQAAGVVNTVV